jgi:hypothetical protein
VNLALPTSQEHRERVRVHVLGHEFVKKDERNNTDDLLTIQELYQGTSNFEDNRRQCVYLNNQRMSD